MRDHRPLFSSRHGMTVKRRVPLTTIVCMVACSDWSMTQEPITTVREAHPSTTAQLISCRAKQRAEGSSLPKQLARQISCVLPAMVRQCACRWVVAAPRRDEAQAVGPSLRLGDIQKNVGNTSTHLVLY